MEIPPFLITHQVLSANKNIGTMDMNKITVVGNTLASVQYPFVSRASLGSYSFLPNRAAYPTAPTTVIRPVRQAMTIDGDLSEWGYAKHNSRRCLLSGKRFSIQLERNRRIAALRRNFLYDARTFMWRWSCATTRNCQP